MRQGMADWSQSWSRRQFLARGGATAGALALGGLIHAQQARGQSSGALSAEEIAVLGALASAVVIALGQTGDGSALGLQSPATVAQTLTELLPAVQTQMIEVLDAIDAAPSSGTFTSLSDSQRQAFMTQALAPLASSATLNATFQQEAESDYDDYAAQVAAGVPPSAADSVSPELVDISPAPPSTPAPVSSQVLSSADLLAFTIIDALQLIGSPFAPPPPPPAALPPAPVGLVSALLEAVTAQLPVDLLQVLADQIVAAVGGDVVEPEYPPPPLAAPAIWDAVRVWVPSA